MIKPVDSSVHSNEESEFLQVAQVFGGGVLGDGEALGDLRSIRLTTFLDDLVDFRLAQGETGGLYLAAEILG